MESDENAVSRAAHLMVATLAGSLAHVTCKVIFCFFKKSLSIPAYLYTFYYSALIRANFSKFILNQFS